MDFIRDLQLHRIIAIHWTISLFLFIASYLFPSGRELIFRACILFLFYGTIYIPIMIQQGFKFTLRDAESKPMVIYYWMLSFFIAGVLGAAASENLYLRLYTG